MLYVISFPVISEKFAENKPKLSSTICRTGSRFILLCIIASGLLATLGLSNLAVAGSAPLVLYTFNEGSGSTVHDISGTGLPLNLTVATPAAVSWNTNGSLKINADTLIASSTAATKVINALKASNAVTFEAWIQPGNTTQTGPARILTLSKDSRLRNFTLGQEEISYIGRLRTTKTDTNGKPQISTPAGTLNTSLTHVVYSRNTSGAVKLFINGVKQQQTTIGGNFSNWDSTYRLALGNELNGGRPWLGTFHQLAIYDRAFSANEVSQAYAAGNNAPVKTTTSSTTTTRVDTAPVAVNDSVTANYGFVYISPLINDSGLNNTPIALSVISDPSRGQVQVQANNMLVYLTNSALAGTDSLTYRVTDADGDMATATVSIKIGCSTCDSASNKNLNVSWNSSSGGVLGYYVYYGVTANTVTTFASTVPGTSTSYTTLAKDLSLQAGEQVCFRVRAYNTAGVSPFSPAVCRII